jgi:hypothetical protein
MHHIGELRVAHIFHLCDQNIKAIILLHKCMAEQRITEKGLPCAAR